MLKKTLSTALAASMLAAMAVVPAHAATFSSSNWAQYERGFYTNTSNFTENMQVYSDTNYGTNQLTSVRMVANTSSKITSQKNPVAYKIGQSASDYGDHASDSASYAHMVFYLATYDDGNHNIFDDFYLRMDKDGTGSSRDAFIFDNWKNDSEIYAVNYTTSAAYTTKDWTGILKKQGYNGNGPSSDTIGAGNEGSQTRVLSDSDYDKIDIIVEYNKQSGATTYIFANGKFMANYYDSGLADKHFHGIVFRTLANKTPRNNSSYIAVKMDPDRIGHREYYNTEGYYVTLEDVMQDAGLGDSVNDSSVMFKTSEIQNYMPGNDQVAYVYPKDASERSRINTNITYSGNTATIAAANTGGDYAVAANMLSGLYPLNGKCGVAYESYHPRAKYIKLSFDQTISNDGMWLEYASYYSGKVQALQMWNNGGNLVVGIKGGQNVTCNGNGGKPTATMTGTNRIDWILEPVDGTNVKQYVFVNNTFAGEGYFGNEYAVRINDIILSTRNAAGNVTIDNWDMTVYNDTATYDAIRYSIDGIEPSDFTWNNYSRQLGYKIGDDGMITVHAVPSNIDGAELDENTKIITAIYDQNNKLINVSEDEQNDANEHGVIANSFVYSKNIELIKLFVWDFTDNKLIPITEAVTVKVDRPIKVLAIGNSFSQDCVRQLREIAAADGVEIVSCNAYLAGRDLKGHYDAWNSDKEYRVEPEGVNSDQYKTLKDFVQMDDWDYIMLQGTTHYNSYDAGLWNVDPANTANYWTTLRDGIAELAPDAKRLVNATWAPINTFAANVNNGMFAEGTPDARGAYLAALLPNEQLGADIYSTETAQGGKAYIPTAVAIDYLIRHYRFPEYQGERDADNKYDNSATTRGVYRDTTCHLTDNVGKVLAGLVWYEMITGTPATESSYQRSTLSSADMANIKAAAHYACVNYTTYDPAEIEGIASDAVEAEAVRVKNNAKAIITIVHDDGSSGTAQYLNREFAKNNLVGTIGMIGGNINNDTKVANWTNILNESNGRFNLASHSYSHKYLGESDDAESGTLSDGTEYDYPAGHLTKEIANERSRINKLFPNERVLTFIKPGTKFPTGKVQISDAAMSMIQDHYIAMRESSGNVDTIPPADYYRVKSLLAKPDQGTQYWINLLSSATNKNGLLVYLFHEIKDVETASGNDVRQSDVSAFLKELSRYVADGRVWNAKFDEAIQYMREYAAVTDVTAINYYDDNIVTVSVSDSISRIDTDITTGKFAGRDMYDYPITVKTEIPYAWDYVKLTQSYDNRVEILKTFTENGKRYVYANVVPDQAAAVLSEAVESDIITSVSYGGTTVSGFEPSKVYYKVTLPGGTTTAPILTCDKGSAVITQASLTDGEGSGFVEYGGIRYEVHFSVE